LWKRRPERAFLTVREPPVRNPFYNDSFLGRGAEVSFGVENTMLALVAVAALALVVQTIGMIALLVVARKAAKDMREEIEQYRSSLTPLILRAREMVQNVAPKVEAAAEELTVITGKLREQTADVQAAANDILSKTQRQVGRVDHILSSVFDRVERAGTFMSDAVSKPLRQLSGVIASVKAVVDTLRQPESGHHTVHDAYRYPDAEPVPPARPPVTPPRPTGGSTSVRP
jgi:methyl-accepting chemotaxis protein